jgi:hypothetical protein
MYQQNNNSGALFKNERKTTDKHPNATGTALIDGVEYYLSAWTKESAKGKWQSLSFKRKDDQTPTENDLVNNAKDIPF